MEMEKRMSKVHISKYEIPMLGFDVGGITVKVTFFDITLSSVSSEDLELTCSENAANVNLSAEKIENRERIKVFLAEYARKISLSCTKQDFVLKDLEGVLHCFLLRREKLNEFMTKLNALPLKRPYFVLTGTALVNYITKLEDQFHARIIIIPSEDESVVRGIEVLHYQTQCQMFHEVNDEQYRPIANIHKSHFYPCLLVVIGTSTSYLILNSASHYTRLNASAVSGQTFFGLCNAAHRLAHTERYKKDEVQTFEQCLKMANEGRSDYFDFTIKQMCGNNDQKVEQFLFLHSFGNNNNKQNSQQEEDYIREFGELPMTVFGDTDPRQKEKIKDKATLLLLAAQKVNQGNQGEMNDFSAAALNMICYQIAETMFMYSKLLKLNLVLCSGGFLNNNSMAKMLIAKYMTLLAHNHTVLESKRKVVYFIDNEPYLAAIGCIGIDCRNIESSALQD